MEHWMRKRGFLRLLLLGVLCMLFIPGCSNQKIESALNAIKTASSKTSELKSGEFEFTYQLKDGDKNAKNANQRVCGSFAVKEKKKVDWTRKIYIADEETPRTEQKQEAGTQYQKSKREDGTEEWIPINENAVGYPPELEELLNITWKVEDIGKVEKEIQDSGAVTYQIDFSESFLKHLKQDRLQGIQKELKRAKEDETTDQVYLDGLEDSIKTYQAINYQNYRLGMVLDSNGIILEYKTAITTADGNEEPELISTATSTVKLSNYSEK